MPTVAVQCGARPYDVLVEAGVLARLPEILRDACPAHRYALIADATVAELHGEDVRARVATIAPCDLFTFPPGEMHKTRAQWAALSDAMADVGIGRDGAVVALGGGVTGDLAGFVAATYRRGIPLVQVPTTVLAMVDSAVGGKTGVDTHHGKNLIGAFHPPRAVVADVNLLRSLPEVHLRGGLVEALKHGAVADRAHFQQIGSARHRLLARDPVALQDVVSRSVAIKAAVVSEDEREFGRRAILNFGHTIGHALESVSGYELTHGAAVALGMVAEAALGEALGITATGTRDAIEQAVRTLGLASVPRRTPVEQVIEAMQQDKKARGGTVKFAFLKDLGQAASAGPGSWTFEAPPNAIRAVLAS